MPNLFDPLFDKCKEHNCSKVLVDAMDLKVKFSILQMFRAGKDIVNFSEQIKILAMIAPKKFYNKFFENVARNRGINLRVFTKKEDAIEWMNSK